MKIETPQLEVLQGKFEDARCDEDIDEMDSIYEDTVDHLLDMQEELTPATPAKKAAHYLQELMRKRYHFFTELERLSLEKAYEILERAEIREERCSLC